MGEGLSGKARDKIFGKMSVMTGAYLSEGRKGVKEAAEEPAGDGDLSPEDEGNITELKKIRYRDYSSSASGKKKTKMQRPMAVRRKARIQRRKKRMKIKRSRKRRDRKARPKMMKKRRQRAQKARGEAIEIYLEAVDVRLNSLVESLVEQSLPDGEHPQPVIKDLKPLMPYITNLRLVGTIASKIAAFDDEEYSEDSGLQEEFAESCFEVAEMAESGEMSLGFAREFSEAATLILRDQLESFEFEDVFGMQESVDLEEAYGPKGPFSKAIKMLLAVQKEVDKLATGPNAWEYRGYRELHDANDAMTKARLSLSAVNKLVSEG